MVVGVPGHPGRHVAAGPVVQGGDGGCDNVVPAVPAVEVPLHPCKPCFCLEMLLLYCKILKIRLL